MTLVHAGSPEYPSERAAGDDRNWTRWLPSMWRALADPDGAHGWPLPPVADETVYQAHDTPAWWMPAVHLMRYSLGWTDPALGLRWWYEAGRPTDDPRFALLAEMLGKRLDELAAFLWLRADEGTVDARWLADVRRRAGAWTPCDGGYDSLHLEGHQWGPASDYNSGPPATLTFNVELGAAHFVVDQYDGWRYHLVREAEHFLPRGPLWKVEVTCRPVGYLGSFRRSDITGAWFAGPHRYHVVGCAAPG